MWTAVIIMVNPLSQNMAKMFLTERDHETQSLPPIVPINLSQ